MKIGVEGGIRHVTLYRGEPGYAMVRYSEGNPLRVSLAFGELLAGGMLPYCLEFGHYRTEWFVPWGW